ncbi:putative uncharacterized protein DDB_G0271606 [Microplitis demolitor]|uniref:putative uncharacterized protein DDB_G0271606 n=1 Tax=Microplitis demolitor TaxID=69319 RepID=UPI0006D4E85F|nr:putative uncharacterized protein DDB_G0271606 [Microplitis demolitor]
MVRACTVKSCPSGRKNKKVVKETSCSMSFFQAKTSARLQHWTKSLGIALKASDYICQFHFKEKDIKMYSKIVIENDVHLHHLSRKDLTEDAVPTIEHQLQLNPQLQQQDQQQLNQEQQQSEQEQLQPEQEQLQSEQQQPEQIPQIEKPISYFRKNLTLLPQHWTYAEKSDDMEFVRIDPVRM